jgi:hypothetical protein
MCRLAGDPRQKQPQQHGQEDSSVGGTPWKNTLYLDPGAAWRGHTAFSFRSASISPRLALAIQLNHNSVSQFNSRNIIMQSANLWHGSKFYRRKELTPLSAFDFSYMIEKTITLADLSGADC